MTGESEPQGREGEEADVEALEAKNIAFFSTNCVEGSGRGVVIRCGDNVTLDWTIILTHAAPSLD